MSPENPSGYSHRIEQAIRYIDAHLAEAIGLEQAARAAAFSPFHFHRIFSAAMGETPDDYVNRLRLERAANYLIKHRERSVTEIARLCGYSSPAGFARAFKKRFGLPASRFRQEKSEEFLSTLGGSLPAGVGWAANPVDTANLRQVRVRGLPPRQVAYVASRRGYDLAAICAAWERLYRWAEARGRLHGAPKMIGVSFDDPFITRSSQCRYYACIETGAAPAPGEPVGCLELSGGRYAVCRVECAAQEIAAVYHTLYGRWLPESGLQPADAPTYEVYHHTPATHPQGMYEIEVCMPIE